MSYNGTELASATGFFYRANSKLFLVTNWHNFTGRDPKTLEPIANHGGIPNEIGMTIGKYHGEESEGKRLLEWKWLESDLNDDQGRPEWLEHPVHGRNVDVAALPIEVPEGFEAFAINDQEFTPITPEVSHDAFILGFPLGIVGPGTLPIWKRATIASEPAAAIGGLPKVLVDTATRKGMSGSPVILRYRGVYLKNPAAGMQPDDWMGEGSDFFGIYSGRLGEDEFKAQLGIVWKASVIEEVIRGARRADLY